MQEFLLKRIIENLLETGIFAQHVNQKFAKRVTELAESAIQMQETLKNKPARDAAEKELKEKINE